VIYVIAPSIWGLIDLPLRADFSPAHPSDCFAIDLPNVPVARARAFRSPTVVLKVMERACHRFGDARVSGRLLELLMGLLRCGIGW